LPGKERRQALRSPAQEGRRRLANRTIKGPRKIRSAMRAALVKTAHFPEPWARPAAGGKWRSCVLSFSEIFQRGNIFSARKHLFSAETSFQPGNISSARKHLFSPETSFQPGNIFSARKHLFSPETSFQPGNIFSARKHLFSPETSLQPGNIFSARKHLFSAETSWRAEKAWKLSSALARWAR
jgi:hypothetical protein